MSDDSAAKAIQMVRPNERDSKQRTPTGVFDGVSGLNNSTEPIEIASHREGGERDPESPLALPSTAGRLTTALRVARVLASGGKADGRTPGLMVIVLIALLTSGAGSTLFEMWGPSEATAKLEGTVEQQQRQIERLSDRQILLEGRIADTEWRGVTEVRTIAANLEIIAKSMGELTGKPVPYKPFPEEIEERHHEILDEQRERERVRRQQLDLAAAERTTGTP